MHIVWNENKWILYNTVKCWKKISQSKRVFLLEDVKALWLLVGCLDEFMI